MSYKNTNTTKIIYRPLILGTLLCASFYTYYQNTNHSQVHKSKNIKTSENVLVYTPPEIKVKNTHASILLSYHNEASIKQGTKTHKYFEGAQLGDLKDMLKFADICQARSQFLFRSGIEYWIASSELDKMSKKYKELAFQTCKKNAEEEKGDNDLMYLAKMYVYGIGTSPDFHRASRIYSELISKGNSDGFLGLGSLYANKNFPKTYSIVNAEKYYKKAIKAENINAELLLGYLYFEPYERVHADVESNKKAFSWFNSSMKKGNRRGKFYVAYMQESEMAGLEKNRSVTKKLYNELIEAGDLLGYYGIICLGGIELKDEISKSLIYASSYEEDYFAKIALAAIYIDGEIVEKDHQQALAYAKDAHNSHLVSFGTNIIYTLYNDKDSPLYDPKKAQDWFRNELYFIGNESFSIFDSSYYQLFSEHDLTLHSTLLQRFYY